MDKWSFSNVLEVLKSPKLVCWVAVTCAFLLFFPDNWVSTVQLEVFREKYGLLIVFPLFGSLSMIAIFIFQWGIAKLTRKRKYRNRLKYLYQLTSEEKKLLKSYIDGNTKTRQLSIMSGVVKGLEYAGVIYRSTEVGCASGAAFDYNMQPWAWHYLNDNRELLND